MPVFVDAAGWRRDQGRRQRTVDGPGKHYERRRCGWCCFFVLQPLVTMIGLASRSSKSKVMFVVYTILMVLFSLYIKRFSVRSREPADMCLSPCW